MIKNLTLFVCLFLLVLGRPNIVKSQDTRNQYPSLLSKAYFDVNIGYINYPFNNSHLESGFAAQSIKVPHPAVRLTLFGYRFNQYLSAQISYMRPVDWVSYNDVTGDSLSRKHTAWMNVGGLTFKYQYPFYKKFLFFAEGGLAVITRRGFGNPKVEMKNANYASVLLGAGIKYRYNNNWDFSFSTTYSPANQEEKQPYTIFHALGFTYNMHPISKERISVKEKAAYVFPHHLLQLGYATNFLDYGVNDFFSEGPVPVFWGGDVYLEKGISLNYLQNVFHTKKVFSLDLGANASFWQSKEQKNKFVTLSVFPLLRFTFLRTNSIDFYFNYSAAGPTFISQHIIDNKDTGKNFTFQDYMGLGVFTGNNRKFNAEIKITHYSNGNIFVYNPGLTIPLTFNIGYTF
ncbi:MAG: acyloxyacyl hydrolase [Bacteroidetes bacterium]|nr:acyloxyacyl hydrolase [Bacteroidota bacterium]